MKGLLARTGTARTFLIAARSRRSSAIADVARNTYGTRWVARSSLCEDNFNPLAVALAKDWPPHMSSDPPDLSKKRFIVSIYEVRQEIVFAEEFNGRYIKNVTMADGTTRTIELTSMMRDGRPVVEFNDTGGRTYIGTLRVGTGTTINGKLMVRVADVDDLEAARAEWGGNLPSGPLLPPDTSLIAIPEFVPAGFTQGIEVFNDSTTPMKFVTDVLTTHAGLSPEESSKTMLAIHTRGGALIPTPSSDEAGRIAAQITAEATKQGHPLLCRPVSINP